MATKVQDFLAQNPSYIGYANTANRDKPKEAPKSKRGSGNQSWLSSIISELGGAGGAASGAAAGAALGSVVPGIGNIVGGIAGGIIGGFGGGTAGRLAENKIRDNEYRLGDALKEGAISGAFGAVGPTWQAARGLGALGKAGGSAGIRGGASLLSGMTDDAAKVAGKAIVKSGAKAGKAIGQGITNADDLAYITQKGFQAAGNRARAAQRGIISGNNGITPAEKVSFNRALDDANKWLSGIGKSKQYENADDALKALANQYKRAPEAIKEFGSKNADELGTQFLQNIDNNPALKNTLKGKNAQIVDNLLNEALGFSKKKNADFIEFMSTKINPRYRTISSGGSAGTVESQILEAFRDAGKGIIDEKLVTRSGINKQYANLLGASKQLEKTITRDIGAGASQGYSLGRVLADVVGPTRDVAGRAMQQTGRATKYTTPLVRGATTRGVLNGSGQTQEAPQEQQMQMQDVGGVGTLTQDALYGNGMQQAPNMQPSAQAPDMMQQEQAPQYTLQQALSEAYQLAPNASESELLSYAKALMAQNETQATGAAGPNITKVTGQQYVLANRGANAVQQLAQLINSDPNVVNRLATPGRKLPIVGGSISKAAGTGDYDAISYNVANALLRLETGAQANPEEIKNLQTQLMPRAGDSAETIQIKLQQLQEAFSAFLNTANGSGALASSISDYQPTYGGM